METTITKKHLVNYLEANGFTERLAGRAIDLLLKYMRDELMAGHKVTLYRVGTLVPKIQPSTIKKVFGEMKSVPAKLSLRIVISRSLSADYRSKEINPDN